MKNALLTTCACVILASFATAQKPPYPQSVFITGIEIDWKTHQRHAQGSDNFPLTWAEDDHQYGPWGDGGGFGGTNELNRVSMGIARIEGPADYYKGYNRAGHPNSSESPISLKGKSWGIICVEGILYMWVHPDNVKGAGAWDDHSREARLYRSTDKGATWKGADWAFTKEENLTGGNILQFGKNYSGARDNYTYHYFSQPNAKLNEEGKITELQMSGKIYLARVGKERMMEKNEYEFFVAFENNKPVWTKNIIEKMPVFEDKNGVGSPMAICYNPGLRRYLLTTEHTAGERGNFGLFESPAPWGPWATVAYMSQNDRSEFGSNFSQTVPPNTFFWTFPTKWMNLSGRDLILTFTGAGQGKNNDSFNTVKVRLNTK